MRILFIFIFCLSTVVSKGQTISLKFTDFAKNYGHYKDSILLDIKKWKISRDRSISIDKYLASTNRDNTIGVRQIVPVVKLHISFDKQTENYRIDNNGFVNSLVAVPDPYVGKIYAYYLHKQTSKNETKVGLSTEYGSKKLFDLFEKHTNKGENNGYFVYFLEEEKHWEDTFIVLDKKTGKTSFYLSARDTNPFRKFTGSKALREVGSIKELIDYRYGSAEKLAELLEEEKEAEACKCTISSLADAEATIKQSWQIRMKYMPEDTIRAMGQFMSALQKIAALDSNQMRILNNNIQYRNDIPLKEMCFFDDYSFVMNRMNYQSFIKKSLTQAQHAKCLKFFKQQADCANRIHFYMWSYNIKNEEDRIRAILRE
jgi:hypothetical protein